MTTPDDFLQTIHDRTLYGRAKKMASSRRWRTLESDGNITWGEARSRSTRWYKSAIDLSKTPVKTYCNCPSRYKPCKHTLALVLLLQNQSGAFRITEHQPAWVKERLYAPPPSVEETEAREAERTRQRQKEREKRLLKMQAGFVDLERQLTDLARMGLSGVKNQNPEFWQQLAARMTDAQLKGVGNRLLHIERQTDTPDWHLQATREFAEIYLLARGFRQMEYLPAPLQDELLTNAGINFRKNDLILEPIVTDDWLVSGQTEGTDDDRLFWRRTWLYGEHSRRFALVLEFAFGRAAYEHHFTTASVIRGDLVYYPAAFPQRAFPLDWKRVDAQIHWPTLADWDALTEKYAAALGKNPWLKLLPACVAEVVPVMIEAERLQLIDRKGKAIETIGSQEMNWKLLACSGGHPLVVFGEWDGWKFRVLSALLEHSRLISFEAPPLPRPERQWS